MGIPKKSTWKTDIYSYLEVPKGHREVLRARQAKVPPSTMIACYYVKFRNKAIGRNVFCFSRSELIKKLSGQINATELIQSVCRISEIDLNLSDVDFKELTSIYL